MSVTQSVSVAQHTIHTWRISHTLAVLTYWCLWLSQSV